MTDADDAGGRNGALDCRGTRAGNRKREAAVLATRTPARWRETRVRAARDDAPRRRADAAGAPVRICISHSYDDSSTTGC